MNRNKLFLNLLFQKQWDFPAQPENPAATACIADKSLRICQRCRLGHSLSGLAGEPAARATARAAFFEASWFLYSRRDLVPLFDSHWADSDKLMFMMVSTPVPSLPVPIAVMFMMPILIIPVVVSTI